MIKRSRQNRYKNVVRPSREGVGGGLRLFIRHALTGSINTQIYTSGRVWEGTSHIKKKDSNSRVGAGQEQALHKKAKFLCREEREATPPLRYKSSLRIGLSKQV
jgi:hypothetical protein